MTITKGSKSGGNNAVDDDDINFNHRDIQDQYKEHLRRKEEIRQKIEKLQREKEFRKNLTAEEGQLLFIKEK